MCLFSIVVGSCLSILMSCNVLLCVCAELVIIWFTKLDIYIFIYINFFSLVQIVGMLWGLPFLLGSFLRCRFFIYINFSCLTCFSWPLSTVAVFMPCSIMVLIEFCRSVLGVTDHTGFWPKPGIFFHFSGQFVTIWTVLVVCGWMWCMIRGALLTRANSEQMKLHKSDIGIMSRWPVGLKTMIVYRRLGNNIVESKISSVFFLYRKEITTVDQIYIIKINVEWKYIEFRENYFYFIW